MRRILSLSVLFSSLPVLAVALPLLLPIAAVVDLLRDRRAPTCRALIWVSGLVIAETAGVVGAGIAWFSSDSIQANYALQRSWSRELIRWTMFVYGARLERVGPALDQGPFLLLPRHASLADTLLPMWVTDGVQPLNPRYVLKKELLWDPCLDLVGNRLPNVFVDRSGLQGEAERVAALAEGLGSHDFVVLFPEGTRFSAQRRAKLIEKLRARGQQDRAEEAERLRNVLPLRPAGTEGLLEKGGLDVVLMAHSGLEGTRTLGDVLRGDLIGRTIRVQLLRFDARLLPKTQAGRAAWLRDAWCWMDDAVGSLQAAA